MVRRVVGLRSVQPVDHPPFRLTGRSKDGAVLAGLAYEKKLAAHTRAVQPFPVLHGQWFCYVDSKSRGCDHCQPDILFGTHDRVVIIESKLTQCKQGDLQLTKLYNPIIHFWTKKPVLMIQAFRNAAYKGEGYHLAHLSQAMEIPLRDFSRVHTYQWVP